MARKMDSQDPTEAWIAGILEDGISANTRRAQASDARFFTDWYRARFEKTPAYPVPLTRLRLYVGDLLGGMSPAMRARLTQAGYRVPSQGYAISTVKRRLSSLHCEHLARGVPSGCLDPQLRQLLIRARRALRKPTRAHSQPISWPMLEAMLVNCGSDLRGLRDQALLLTGWCGGRRRCELSHLSVDDVNLSDGYIHIRYSKTDQDGSGLVVPLPELAIQALADWLKMAEITSGPAFRQINRREQIGGGLSGNSINETVKRAVERAGFDPSHYSAHGLRYGFIEWCQEKSIPLQDMKALSGHRDDKMAVGYVSNNAKRQNRAVDLINYLVQH